LNGFYLDPLHAFDRSIEPHVLRYSRRRRRWRRARVASRSDDFPPRHNAPPHGRASYTKQNEPPTAARRRVVRATKKTELDGAVDTKSRSEPLRVTAILSVEVVGVVRDALAFPWLRVLASHGVTI
jgi:hypothetical protein